MYTYFQSINDMNLIKKFSLKSEICFFLRYHPSISSSMFLITPSLTKLSGLQLSRGAADHLRWYPVLPIKGSGRSPSLVPCTTHQGERQITFAGTLYYPSRGAADHLRWYPVLPIKRSGRSPSLVPCTTHQGERQITFAGTLYYPSPALVPCTTHQEERQITFAGTLYYPSPALVPCTTHQGERQITFAGTLYYPSRGMADHLRWYPVLPIKGSGITFAGTLYYPSRGAAADHLRWYPVLPMKGSGRSPSLVPCTTHQGER